VNTTNTPQFSNPNGSCCTANNSNFGFVTRTIGSGSGSINAGTGGPRTLQLAGTFTFYLRFSDRGGAPPDSYGLPFETIQHLPDLGVRLHTRCRSERRCPSGNGRNIAAEQYERGRL
jgi:hypothetical protein